MQVECDPSSPTIASDRQSAKRFLHEPIKNTTNKLKIFKPISTIGGRVAAFVFHVVGDDDTDEKCEANHAADEDEEMDEDGVRLKNNHILLHLENLGRAESVCFLYLPKELSDARTLCMSVSDLRLRENLRLEIPTAST